MAAAGTEKLMVQVSSMAGEPLLCGHFDANDTVLTVHHAIKRTDGTPEGLQKLMLRNQALLPQQTLAEASVRSGSVLTLVKLKQPTWHQLCDPRYAEIMEDGILAIQKGAGPQMPPSLNFAVASNSLNHLDLEVAAMLPAEPGGILREYGNVQLLVGFTAASPTTWDASIFDGTEFWEQTSVACVESQVLGARLQPGDRLTVQSTSDGIRVLVNGSFLMSKLLGLNHNQILYPVIALNGEVSAVRLLEYGFRSGFKGGA